MVISILWMRRLKLRMARRQPGSAFLTLWPWANGWACSLASPSLSSPPLTNGGRDLIGYLVLAKCQGYGLSPTLLWSELVLWILARVVGSGELGQVEVSHCQRGCHCFMIPLQPRFGGVVARSSPDPNAALHLSHWTL